MEEAERQMEAMRLEMSTLHKQLDIERDTHKKESGKLRAQPHQNESLNADHLQKLNKKLGEERDFMEREIHRVNIKANESKAARRDAERKMVCSQEELQSIMQQNINLQSETDKFREKYVIAKTFAEDKDEEVSKTSATLRKLEDDLLFARDRVTTMEQDIEVIQTAISQDLEGMSAALRVDETAILVKSHLSFSDVDVPNGDVYAWLSSIRHRIGAIKREILEKESEREKLLEHFNINKYQMKEVCKTMEEDRRMLMTEANEQNKLVDVLSREKTSLLLENREARRIVQELEGRVSNMTFDLETSKVRAQESLLHEKPVKLDRRNDQKEFMKERERIQKRYTKYKTTLKSLQNDLEVVRPVRVSEDSADDTNHSS